MTKPGAYASTALVWHRRDVTWNQMEEEGDDLALLQILAFLRKTGFKGSKFALSLEVRWRAPEKKPQNAEDDIELVGSVPGGSPEQMFIVELDCLPKCVHDQIPRKKS